MAYATKTWLAAAAVVAIGIAGPAHADLISDGSFESVAALASGGSSNVAVGSGASIVAGGWTWSTGAADIPYNSATLINTGAGSPWITADTQTGFSGNYVAGLQGLGAVSQTFTNTAGSGNFDLDYVLAGRGYETSAGYQTVDITLVDNTTSSTLYSGSFSTTGGSAFTAFDDIVSLNTGDSYTVSFAGTTGNGDDETALLDSVSLDQAVPTPSSLSLFAAGIALLFMARRRLCRLPANPSLT